MITHWFHNLLMATFALAIVFGTAAVRDAGAVEVVASSDQVIELERGKAKLIRLDEAASTVFVANPVIADVQIKSPTLMYVFGSRVGETTLFAVDEDDQVVASVIVRVNHNLTRLKEAIGALAPANGIEIYSVDGSLVLEGVVDDADLAFELQRLVGRFVPEGDSLINRLRVDAPNQVNLRVRIAEVSRSAVKTLGVNWESVFQFGNFVFGLATGVDFVSDVGQIVRPSEAVDNVFGGFSSSNFSINALIDALADEGLLTVLAEPNLTSTSGEPAGFLAGGEFPIPVPKGDNGISVDFKEFGVQLSFTPIILSNNRISLRVKPEVSQLSASGSVEIQGFIIPALTTRRAETTVELASGQSFAIGGLIQNNINHDVSKFPGLGDLPVLGQLFRSDQFQRNETELVIIVTPYLVRPVSSDRLASPTDDHLVPNDLERILDGTNYSEDMVAPPGGRSPEAHLTGPAGFMIE